MKMKKIVFALMAVLSACGISKQAKQIRALENCTYELTSADSVFIAGADVNKLLNSKSMDLSRVPGLALGLLRRDIPLDARLNLRVKNPSGDLASVNQFEYIILIKGNEIARGEMNNKISIAPGAVTDVPVTIKTNIYQFVSDGKTLGQIIDFINGGTAGGPEKKGLVTLKIKPSILVSNKLVKYPGYITITKEVSSRMFF